MKKYSEQELLIKFKGKFIDTQAQYNYEAHKWEYEVRGKANIIRENYNLPEDCVIT